MSLDGWNGVGNAPDRGIDVHMDGIRRPGGRHGRQSSVYQSQTTTLFNVFEESDGNPGMLPAASHPQQHQQHRKMSNSTDLRRLKDVDESVDGDEDDEDADGDRRALLNKGKPRQ